MRAFIGLDFDGKVKNQINGLQERVKHYAKKGGWKRVDNLHLTLKFLGDISITQQARIDDVMASLCKEVKPFSLKLTDLGSFNGKDSIRVLWLGLAGEIQELHSLHRRINKRLVPIGFPMETRRFTPHITMGQNIVFEKSFGDVRDAIGEVQLGTVRVDRLFLFKSEQV